MRPNGTGAPWYPWGSGRGKRDSFPTPHSVIQEAAVPVVEVAAIEKVKRPTSLPAGCAPPGDRQDPLASRRGDAPSSRSRRVPQGLLYGDKIPRGRKQERAGSNLCCCGTLGAHKSAQPACSAVSKHPGCGGEL
ncbi:hypothetical protein NDU88_008302 [Pleurodeles waltl]|uniref:Uncharacterized protein n=1 Tax=Pleurodeles waltl TaxID=8319 RepID=A0AAV7VWT0_PLEWA|nr:hypothetical protein NDU88_008302 [Pleurodeles waltl]